MDNLLVLDCNWLCHRAFHATANLTYEGEDTNVIFGFFSQLTSRKFIERFANGRWVFCWDSKKSFRKNEYPEYKRNRRADATPEEKEAYESMFRQMDILRKEILPDMGFMNVLHQVGLEADDLIAMIAKEYDDFNTTVITADHDLYQCLAPKVFISNPWSNGQGSSLTRSLFKRLYDGIVPEDWAMVKAIAGCSGDNVEGIKGVAEITAVKYLVGRATGKKLADIQSDEGQATIQRNLPLVTLPHPKTKSILLLKNQTTMKQVKLTLGRFGIRALIRDRKKEWERFCYG